MFSTKGFLLCRHCVFAEVDISRLVSRHPLEKALTALHLWTISADCGSVPAADTC